MTMTFEQFQATRKPCADLGAFLSDARWEDEPTPATGFIYCDALYIEDVAEHWPPASKEKGRYHLIIGRMEWMDFELEPLERHLYEFAVSEGFC